MYIIEETEIFSEWLDNLNDQMAVVAIVSRIDRAKQGNFGDHKSVGDGVYEMRITKGKGYRIYYARKGEITYILTNGGDKSTQSQDIDKAKQLWQQIKQELKNDH
ncbi:MULTISPECIES: type II toxin-antitoxin system RelE/ParE family toxin [unclassified Lonepinella]|uniref:type II toxin-antitoxin system RelE/ParE family toxin n=1 Tax=unclassified Lonepinella TaxID=2642006 RepID=UPI0036D9FE8C